MKNKLGVIVLSLLCRFGFGQTHLPQSLHGQVINDSKAIEVGYVFNLNSKATTYIRSDGFF